MEVANSLVRICGERGSPDVFFAASLSEMSAIEVVAMSPDFRSLPLSYPNSDESGYAKVRQADGGYEENVRLIRPWFLCSGRGYESSHWGILCSSGLVTSSTTTEQARR